MNALHSNPFPCRRSDTARSVPPQVRHASNDDVTSSKDLFGFYRVTGIRHDDGARLRANLIIENSQGFRAGLRVSRTASLLDVIRSLPDMATVQLCARHYEDDVGSQGWELEKLWIADADTVPYAAELFPRIRVPSAAHAALDALVCFSKTIDRRSALGFLNRVLLDPAIGLPLLTAKASQQHHHAYSGGLLVHTLEVMRTVRVMAVQKFGERSDLVLACQLAALLHDLGKVMTHPGDAMSRSTSAGLTHEQWSLKLVQPHLTWLKNHDAGLAEELEAVLQRASRNWPLRQRQSSAVAELVSLADQSSAVHLLDGARRARCGTVQRQVA